MPVASMTGFARTEGESPAGAFVWELRSVNGKGLELRLRLPPGFEAVEPELRRLAAAKLTRGNVQAALSLAGGMDRPRFAVNEAFLADVLALSDRLVAAGHAVTPTADGILALRGVIDTAEPAEGASVASDAAKQAVVGGFGVALEGLEQARQAEGAAIAATLRERLALLSRLVERAESDPARQPAALFERLKGQVGLLLQSSAELDEQRLHAEAAILATRADIREELDRLRAHIASATSLIDGGGPIGRRLDFLSQEFNRESNTLCAKSNATSLTAIGLELKVVVDQFREQVQNIE